MSEGMAREQYEKQRCVQLSGEDVATEVSDQVFVKCKAKIFNLLESQLGLSEPVEVRFGEQQPESAKLKAVKRIAQDIIGEVSEEAKHYIVELIGDNITFSVNVNKLKNENSKTKYE